MPNSPEYLPVELKLLHKVAVQDQRKQVSFGEHLPWHKASPCSKLGARRPAEIVSVGSLKHFSFRLSQLDLSDLLQRSDFVASECFTALSRTLQSSQGVGLKSASHIALSLSSSTQKSKRHAEYCKRCLSPGNLNRKMGHAVGMSKIAYD